MPHAGDMLCTNAGHIMSVHACPPSSEWSAHTKNSWLFQKEGRQTRKFCPETPLKRINIAVPRSLVREFECAYGILP